MIYDPFGVVWGTANPFPRWDAVQEIQNILEPAAYMHAGLTALHIGFATGPLMKALAPNLTASRLVQFTTDLPSRFQKVALMGDNLWLGEFAMNSPPLSKLQSLCIRSTLREGGQGAEDVVKLSSMLENLQV